MRVDAKIQTALRLALVVDVLRLSLSALDLAGEPNDSSLRQIKQLEDAVRDLEIPVVTLLVANGSTWQEMAEQVGVARQSLHRRLARKSDKIAHDVHVIATDQVGLNTEWHRLIEQLLDKVQELRETGGLVL